MKYFITGGAGFIGSNLADRFLRGGHQVVVYDNFSTGHIFFIEHNLKKQNYRLIKADLLDFDTLNIKIAEEKPDFVFHFAANADVRYGTENTKRDLDQNTIATYNILEAMRRNSVRKIAFSSTGSIYGEPEVFPTPEDAPFPAQTSFYGASKLAGEGLIQAFCSGFEIQSWIFRFVSILGERYTHGHVFDFYKSLLKNPEKLLILGNGKQRKSYLYIQDCLDAMLLAIEKAQKEVNIFNLGTEEHVDVDYSVDVITQHLGLNPAREYTGEERGWIGDSPFIFLDISKIKALGFLPKVTIKEAIVKTVEYLVNNKSLLLEKV